MALNEATQEPKFSEGDTTTLTQTARELLLSEARGYISGRQLEASYYILDQRKSGEHGWEYLIHFAGAPTFFPQSWLE
jgi:hypothetical protein